MLPHLKMLALLALNLQPLVLTQQCLVRFMEGEKMMWIVRNSAPAPLLRRHQRLFLQGKPLHEDMVYVETLLCFRHDSAIALLVGQLYCDRTAKDGERSVSFAHCQAAET